MRHHVLCVHCNIMRLCLHHQPFFRVSASFAPPVSSHSLMQQAILLRRREAPFRHKLRVVHPIKEHKANRPAAARPAVVAAAAVKKQQQQQQPKTQRPLSARGIFCIGRLAVLRCAAKRSKSRPPSANKFVHRLNRFPSVQFGRLCLFPLECRANSTQGGQAATIQAQSVQPLP